MNKEDFEREAAETCLYVGRNIQNLLKDRDVAQTWILASLEEETGTEFAAWPWKVLSVLELDLESLTQIQHDRLRGQVPVVVVGWGFVMTGSVRHPAISRGGNAYS